MPRNIIRTETPPPVSRPAAAQPGNSGPTVQYSKPQSSTTSLDRRSRIVSDNPAVSVSRTKDTPSVNVSPNVSQARNAPGKSATVADRDRISQPAQKTLLQGKADRIGSVIGQTTIDKGIARRGKDKAERQVARETDMRSITGEKTADLARESLTRRDNVNRETPQKTVMPTPHTDFQKAGRTLEREQPGHRTEKVFKSNVRERTTIMDKNIVEKRIEYRGDRASRTIIYHDRPYDIRRTNHYDYIYRDRHNNFCHIAVGPQYCFWVNYSCGASWTFTYVHPFYHRKYIFISLGGWWPEYSCVRYYWYDYHPFEWYGFYPVPQEVYGGNTYNYYTYNYYNTTADTGSAAASYAVPDQIPPVDHTTFADVRAKMQQQAESTPDAATKADEYFDEAVKAFEINCFNLAADKFAEAMKLAPDDMILPFAYSQSLLALERYTEAADVLRTALVKVTPDKEGVFYPRGLYADEDVLTNQIELLSEKAKLYPYDADLQLLLGYQMLGLGELDEAEGPLTIASQDTRNAPAADVLLNLLAEMRARVQDSNDIQPNSQ
jgi:tetratricopeptide (TPR) repeat protein